MRATDRGRNALTVAKPHTREHLRRTMTRTLAAPSLDDVQKARDRLAGVALRTPLLPFPDAGDVHLKLENLQPIGSFKLRGAANAMAIAGADALANGVYTASAGNMAQGVAWCARAIGVRC
jgi:threonine dehydratase